MSAKVVVAKFWVVRQALIIEVIGGTVMNVLRSVTKSAILSISHTIDPLALAALNVVIIVYA